MTDAGSDEPTRTADVVVVAGTLLQVTFGTFSMTIAEAWRAVFDPNVVLNPAAWNAFLFGGELPELSKQSLVVRNIRLPRVLVAIFVGANLAVSGAIFQAVTRNELASPFILGVSSGAGLAIFLTLVVFSRLTAFLPLVASVGGAIAFLTVYAIPWKNGTSPVRLVLAGVSSEPSSGVCRRRCSSLPTTSASSRVPSHGPPGR